MLTLTLLAVLLMMVVSGLCSATETALLSASRARLHHLSRKGKPHKRRRAQLALALLGNTEQFLSTIVIINNTLNVASSTLASAALVVVFGPVGVAYATVVMSVLILLLAEAMPKALGTRLPEAISLAMAPLLTNLIRWLRPLLWCVAKVIGGVLWLLRLKNVVAHGVTEADLRGAISLARQGGGLSDDQAPMLEAVLDLSTLTAADVMVHRSAMVALDVHTPPEDVPAKLASLGHSRLPVYDGTPDHLVGLLSVRDYLTALAGVTRRHDVNLKALLKPLYFIPETTPVNFQLKAFLQRHEHLALVVDEYGDVQGLLSLEDILEEIVGDIADEQDRRRGPQGLVVEDHGDGHVVVAGRMNIRDANRQFGWELPDDSAVTLAGLLQDELGYVPTQGETVTLGNLRVTVLVRRGHRLEKLDIKPLTPTSPAVVEA